MMKRYEGTETGEALRHLLALPQEEQPFIAIRTTVPNMITEGIRVNIALSSDNNGEIALACRFSGSQSSQYWYWSDADDNTGEHEITYVEF